MMTHTPAEVTTHVLVLALTSFAKYNNVHFLRQFLFVMSDR